MKAWVISYAVLALGFLSMGFVLGEEKSECSKPVTHHERQLSPHETQPEPTPALAPGRWIEERYQL